MYEITVRDALAVVETGLRAGAETGVAISIAVIDGGGNLLAFARMDAALLASVEVSQVKARTALFFGTETRNLPFAQPFTPALLGAVSYPVAFVAGGVPIRRSGKLIGAVGVGGGTAELDHAISAQAASLLNGID